MNEESLGKNRPSRAMRAVLAIFTVDEELEQKALAFVDVENDRINWGEVLASDYGGGHGAAVKWALALWSDCVPEGAVPFGRAMAMDDRLRIAVLTGIAIQWGVRVQ